MRAKGGSVLMEYVLLLVLVGLGVLACSTTFWSFDTGWGTLGVEVVGWAHRLAATIALPLI